MNRRRYFTGTLASCRSSFDFIVSYIVLICFFSFPSQIRYGIQKFYTSLNIIMTVMNSTHWIELVPMTRCEQSLEHKQIDDEQDTK